MSDRCDTKEKNGTLSPGGSRKSRLSFFSFRSIGSCDATKSWTAWKSSEAWRMTNELDTQMKRLVYKVFTCISRLPPLSWGPRVSWYTGQSVTYRNSNNRNESGESASELLQDMLSAGLQGLFLKQPDIRLALTLNPFGPWQTRGPRGSRGSRVPTLSYCSNDT